MFCVFPSGTLALMATHAAVHPFPHRLRLGLTVDRRSGMPLREITEHFRGALILEKSDSLRYTFIKKKGHPGESKMRMKHKWIAAILAVVMVFALAMPVLAFENEDQTQLFEMLQSQTQQVTAPTVSQTGGEWLIIALARSGAPVPAGYYDTYYQNVEKKLRENGGVLSSTKNTEYSRVILALTAIGKDPRNVAGYDLTQPLADYDKTIRQGVNGAIFALIALNSGGYEMPKAAAGTRQATKEMYLSYILSAQNKDGGFGLAAGSASGVDLTAMAVQALAGMDDSAKAQKALQKALKYLGEQQTGEGGYRDYDGLNAESTAQVIIALRSSEDSWTEKEFPAGTEGMLDSLMEFAVSGKGFSHLRDPLRVDPFASEQGLLALTSEYRSHWGTACLYDMTDGFTPAFQDTVGDPNQGKIFSMAEKGIINGKATGIFDPTATMTRAEFATIVVRGLGLPVRQEPIFEDVRENDWFYGYAAAAYRAGIIKGVSATRFDPQGTITRQEALTMVARAAIREGAAGALPASETERVLAGISDGSQVSDWARDSVALCLKTELAEPRADGTISPQERVRRSEIAGIIYNLYQKMEDGR